MSGVTFTYDEGNDGIGQHCNCKIVIAAWTSDASGNASGTIRKISGRLVKAVTVPGAAGAAPTDNYDINITDEQSVDVLANCKLGLANRDTANTEEQYFLLLNNDGTALSMAMHPKVCNALTVAVTNAGNAKSGTLYLYYEPV
jgi:hypothetical protein